MGIIFQAKDSMRNLVQSRELRDVYKSQAEDHRREEEIEALLRDLVVAVSYTQLTFPMSDLV